MSSKKNQKGNLKKTKKQDQSAKNQNNSTSKKDLQIKQLNAQISDLKNKLLKALADYQNLLKEIERKEKELVYIAKKEVFKDLMELFTDLYISVQNLDDKARENPYIKGVLLILEKYENLLKKHGVEQIVYSQGQEYSLADAEIIGVEEHPEHDNKVKTTVEPGYKIGPYILRPAKIIVYKKKK